MPIFRVTKKLATALKVKLPKEPVASVNHEHEWFADIFASSPGPGPSGNHRAWPRNRS